jgi:serine/threonine protein kinase
MGTVYKARHKHLNREVALKVLKRDAAGDDLNRKRFENEAKAASTLHHLNLIAVTDFGFAAGLGEGGIDCPFLVMDYVEGQSLTQLLKQCNSLSDEQFLNIMVQICAGLAHAHEKGLIHRDLKPSNILVTRDDDGHDIVKVVDFGLAKSMNCDQDLTSTGQIFGTPLYMSPEQCQGRKLDARSDVYSLGCLMYRLLSGHLPFSGDTPVTTIVMHVKDAPPAIPEGKLDSKFKRALVPIILKALEKEPAARQQSVNEMRIELISAMEGLLKDNAPSEPITQPIDAHSDAPMNKKGMAIRIVASTMLPLVVVAAVLTSVVSPKAPNVPAPPPQTIKTEKAAVPVQPPQVISSVPAVTQPPAVTHHAVRHAVHHSSKKRGFWKTLISKMLN